MNGDLNQGACTRDELRSLAAWGLPEPDFLAFLSHRAGRPVRFIRRDSLRHPLTPEIVAIRFGQEALSSSAIEADGALAVPGDLYNSFRFLVEERWLSPRAPRHAGLPIHALPGSLRLALYPLANWRPLRGREPDEDEMPRWPVEGRADRHRIGLGRRLAQGQPGTSADSAGGPWPGGKRYALCVTHDVDTRRGLKPAARQLDTEAALGLRPTFFLVGDHYRWDPGLCSAIQNAGGEIGLHGVSHDNRIAFLDPDAIRRRLDRSRALIEAWAIRGFRSPSLLVTPGLLQVVGERFQWDSSSIDTDRDTIMGPRRGCGTVFPHRRNGVMELPVTTPADDRLLLRGERGIDFLERLRAKCRAVASMGGVVHILNHSEPHLAGSPALHDLYRSLYLDLLEPEDAWITTPSELAEFWCGLEDEARQMAATWRSSEGEAGSGQAAEAG